MTGVGFVTGLRDESHCLERYAGVDPDRIRCAGADSARAVDGAEALLAGGCGALVSFGVAGALSKELRPGTLILPDAVVCASGRRFSVDTPWRDRVAASLSTTVPVFFGCIAGSRQPVSTATAKLALAAAGGGVAVDMESEAVAVVAARHGCPMIAVRAVADPADRAVPSWMSACVDAQGRTRTLAALRRLALSPWDAGSVAILAVDYLRAMRTLGRVALGAGAILRRLDR
ncbi:MAG: hypothetical protein EA406_10705 [Rhodospirillales bacterium]|nr:MAG: hypothetical protein EA406_10705 [Rhodospirillales bacterium]